MGREEELVEREEEEEEVGPTVLAIEHGVLRSGRWLCKRIARRLAWVRMGRWRESGGGERGEKLGRKQVGRAEKGLDARRRWNGRKDVEDLGWEEEQEVELEEEEEEEKVRREEEQ